MSYVSAEILNSDKKGVNEHGSDANNMKGKMDFDTRAKTESLIEAMPKKQSKPTVTGEIDKLANDMREFA